jgi:hypothetical protein
MIATDKTIRRATAVRPGALFRKTRRKRAQVIVFPVFESYNDQIAEWLSALGEQTPTRASIRQVTRSLLCAVANLERVRNSTRHTNLACLMRHTVEALWAREWDGARYLMMTGSALLHARAVRPGVSLNGTEAGCVVLQFPPMPETATELTTVDATTGMVTG